MLLSDKIAEAISQNLQALVYWKKTDSDWLGGKIYAELTLLYVKLGDVQKAEEYYEKLTEIPPESLTHLGSPHLINRVKRVLTAAKSHWQVSNEFSDVITNSRRYEIPMLEIADRHDYAFALQKQGKVVEANAQIEA